MIDSLYLDLPKPTDDRKPKKIPLNEKNFAKKEFQELWGRINHKAVYQVEFDSAELIEKCIAALDKNCRSPRSSTSSTRASRSDALDAGDLALGAGFDGHEVRRRTPRQSRHARRCIRPAR